MKCQLVLLLLAGLVAAPVAAEERALATLALHHRLAEDIATIVRPLLAPGETVIPSPAGLIVQASPDRLAEITALVGELDRPQRRLMITVAQGIGLTRERLDARATFAVRIDPSHPEETTSSGGGHFYQSETRQSDDSVQRVQTLEGQAAYIQFGKRMPLPRQPVVSPYDGRLMTGPGIEYRDVTTGFAVTPRLTGDGQVTLDIAPWSDRLGRGGGGIIETQGAHTHLLTRLGEWVELGSEIGSSELSNKEPLGQHYTTRSDTRKIFIRVDDLDGGR